MGAHDLNSMADGLMEETMLETATTFFGARKALEDEIELYRMRAGELGEIEQGVLRRASALHSLLPGPDAVRGLYAALGVEPGHLLDADELEEPEREGIALPRAFTARGRYLKLLLEAYAVLVDAADAYMHGRDYADDEGRMRVTINYEHLQKWCADLNTSIEALNRNHSPSGTLCFVRGLDPSKIDKNRLSGATLDGYCRELDRELDFAPVECVAVSYLAAPELPALKDAAPVLKAYAKSLYAQHPEACRKAVDAWREAAVPAS